MNLSINGQSQVPPGFRFHPTEEELLHYYLRKKLASHKIDLDVISEVDLNKLEPWDIQEKCKIGSTPQNDWYFFSHKDKKYPTGTRTNRATIAGFWKATGRDKIIYSGFTRIGLRKTLVFYKGRAPRGLKSDWIMHEYRLDEGSNDPTTIVSSSSGESCGEDGWVVCRVFKKKNYLKTMESPSTPNATSNVHVDSNLHNHHHPLGSRNDGVLDQILMYMGRSSSNTTTCKIENNNELVNTFSDRFMHLPRLDSPTSTTLNNSTTSIITSSNFNDQEPISFKTYYDQTTSFGEILVQPDHQPCSYNQLHDEDDHNHAQNSTRVNDWVALDRLVASQLNGSSTTDQEENEISKQLSFFGDTSIASFCSSDDQNDNDIQLPCQYICTSSSGDRSRNNQTSSTTHEVYGTNCDNDLWKYFSTSTKPSQSSAPSPDPLCHMSV